MSWVEGIPVWIITPLLLCNFWSLPIRLHISEKAHPISLFRICCHCKPPVSTAAIQLLKLAKSKIHEHAWRISIRQHPSILGHHMYSSHQATGHIYCSLLRGQIFLKFCFMASPKGKPTGCQKFHSEHFEIIARGVISTYTK